MEATRQDQDLTESADLPIIHLRQPENSINEQLLGENSVSPTTPAYSYRQRSEEITGTRSLLDRRGSDAAHHVEDLYKSLIYYDVDCFRLLLLYKGAGSESLSGALLQPVQLDWGHIYDALSYRWSKANEHDGVTINIDGMQFPIAPDLHAALVQFRSESVNRWLWVDQICINQKDDEEKVHQIRIMSKIYHRAQKVLIWLGKADDTSDVAMEFYPIFVELVRRNEVGVKGLQSGEAPADCIERGGALAIAMQRLFERPWFGRVWTLQEATLGREAEVWCGNKCFQFSVLEKFQRGFDNDKYGQWATALSLIGSGMSGADPENPSRPLNAHIHTISMLKARGNTSVRILNSLRYLDCSDDKDRIYSVLHFLGAKLEKEVTVKKKPSVADLFHLVAAHEIQGGEMNYLGAAGMCQQRRTYQVDQQQLNEDYLLLPSWVSDWTYRPRTRSYWVDNHYCMLKREHALFTAGGLPKSKFPCSVSTDGKILRVKGILLPTPVGQCVAPFRFSKCPEDTSDLSANLIVIQDMLDLIQQQIVSCVQLATECTPKYGSSDINRACRRSLIGGMMPGDLASTLTAVCIPVTDSVVDSLFEGFHKYATHFKSINDHVDRIKQRFAQGDDFTEEDVALAKKFASASEEMKDMDKKNNLIQAMADACKGRRFFITSCKRYMGVAPDITSPGDQICIIAGACAPFIIRPKGERYLLVGECYVDGIMGGEVMRDEKDKLQTIPFE